MSFSERLLKSRKKLGYTQQDVADLMDVSRPAVNNWENAHEESFPNSKNLDKLAQILKVEAAWLRFGDKVNINPKDDILNQRIKLIVHTAPVLALHEIGPWLEHKKPILKKGALMTDSEVQGALFSVVMSNDSMVGQDMTNSLIEGEILLVDPSFQEGLKSGDLVLIQHGKTDNYKARKYSKDGTEEILVAFNKKFPNIPLDDNVKIVGKITHSVRPKI